MPRNPKPYYRKAQKRWVCTINGKRITLGEDREEAFDEFHRLMLEQENLNARTTTLYELSQAYLDWVLKNRAKGTYDLHKHYLESFIESVGRTLKIGSLRQHHLTAWTDKDAWNSTTRNDAIGIVQRTLNWAIGEGHITRSPIPKVAKPKRLRREVFYTDEQWTTICSHVKDGFRDLLDFLWDTGCRPKEARELEARHVHLDNDMVLFFASEAKGEEVERVIFLTDRSKQILAKLIKKHPEGPLFRNRNGVAWTKDAIGCRTQRLSEKVGFRVIAYGARHSYATHGLMNGTDSVVLSNLMGHKDPGMLAKVYQKLSQNPEFLKRQARQVRSA